MNGALASWVPPEVLVSVLAIALGLLFKQQKSDAKETKESIKELTKAVVEMDKRFVSSATVEQLGRMGDRLDGRITTLAQDVAVMKAVGERK